MFYLKLTASKPFKLNGEEKFSSKAKSEMFSLQTRKKNQRLKAK
jgi:hypothetical protein